MEGQLLLTSSAKAIPLVVWDRPANPQWQYRDHPQVVLQKGDLFLCKKRNNLFFLEKASKAISPIEN